MSKLSETIVTKKKLTFTIPNVLLKFEDGPQPILTLRRGGHREVDYTISTDYYDGPVDESSYLFVIKAKNMINFGGMRIEVLNDTITGDKPIAPSCPTASDYMANVGKEVLLRSQCTKQIDKNIYRVVRSKIILP